jgi:hypothetical protein
VCSAARIAARFFRLGRIRRVRLIDDEAFIDGGKTNVLENDVTFD